MTTETPTTEPADEASTDETPATVTPTGETPAGRWIPCEEDASGHSFGSEELAAVTEVLTSGRLLSDSGGFVGRLEEAFAARYGAAGAVACSSATSGIQAALVALGLPRGAEVITTPLTDIGGVAPIVAAGLVPVFADVDPVTGNLDPASVEAAVGPRTEAIVVTHLVGKPCDMTALAAIAERHRLLIVEDCAQAYDARHAGVPVGTFGAIACYSTQQTKHISAGEGGLMLVNDPGLIAPVRSWINKGVEGGVRSRTEDHPIVGANARMTELQAAVLCAQLDKLTGFVTARITRARELSAALADIPALTTPSSGVGEVQTYWKYLLSVDPHRLPGVRERLDAELDARRAVVQPCYLHLPLFTKSLFDRHAVRLVGESAAATGRRPATAEGFDGMRGFTDRAVVLWWNERIGAADVARIADLVHTVVAKG
ncbi:DegT/DnrJ/EryC1/StrS family aminotransferase [Kitasatospora misakiensis]|uniref:DegT/DnrJ/EryC1/StrS family aminotransferase n=1 Tax=Kitasatospora misakiensis TaxID=67330 RepID=A0ABW0X9X6_9ACTN